jgi:membrane protein DedA with SNARE-associated domain
VTAFVREHKLGVAIAALAVLFLLFRDELPDLDLEQLIEDLSGTLGEWTYLLVGGLAFLETGAFVGLIAPGEFTVLLGGAVAGQGDISLPLIMAITWFSAWAGDTASFFLGQKLGREFLIRHGDRVRITEPRLHQVEGYFDRHGGKTILVGRFIGLVRALAPFIAGSSAMRYRAFVPYSILGTGLWAISLILIGYFFAQSLDRVADLVGQGLILFGILVGVVVGVIALSRYLRDAENRRRVVAEMERRPLLRPLLVAGRWVAPQARFVWARLTPGGLGLELTSLFAVLAVALFALIAYAGIVSDQPRPTGADATASDLAAEIRSDWLTDLSKAITTLGASYVALPIAAIAGLVLAARRRWIELVVLAAGVALIAGATEWLKETIERPRPPDPLAGASGYAYPSRHAAYSTIYVWLGLTLALRVAPGLTLRGAAIAAGIAVAALVGLTRVYLRVHYLSDVTGGWGLGLAAFSGCAVIALVAAHIRQN